MARILIVDDEFGLAEMTGELLALLGHEIATAINGKLALAALEHAAPDLLLLDVMMPVMSGPELLAELAASERHRDLPVLLMSAVGSESVPEEALARACGFLLKPFTLDELVAAVSRCLPPT